MPTINAGDVNLYYEEDGSGVPVVFAHEFAGDYRSWEAQMRFFNRRYRTIAYNARGYPPSDVPDDPLAYSQAIQVEDLRAVLDALEIEKAHIVGFSMGGSCALQFGVDYPERTRSLVLAGTGAGSSSTREAFVRDIDYVARRFLEEGIEKVAEFYMHGPTRVQFKGKDPRGWREFYEHFRGGSAKGHANTLLGVQRSRPSVFDFEADLKEQQVPTLIIVGDEDGPCLEPALYLKRTIPSAGLVTFPKTGHTVNLEEPDLFNDTLLRFFTLVDSGRWTLRDPASLSDSAVLGPAELERASRG